MLKRKALSMRFPLLALAAVMALALLALACEEEEEAATPTPAVTRTPAATPAATSTPTVLKPGAAGIASNPRSVRGLEDVLAMDDGLAIFKQRPASEDRTGVTPTTVKICASSALSGPVAPLFATGQKVTDELIKRINEVAGGIHGRKIQLVVKDDQYRPDVAVTVWKEMVEVDQCFASFGMSGAAQLAANVDYLKSKKVPSIQAQTGDTRYCEPTDELLFCTGVPSFLVEGKAMGEYILSQKPDAKVAVIYDTVAGFGPVLLQGVKAAIPASQIVEEIAYEAGTPDVTPLARTAAESGAEYLAILSNAPVPGLVKALRETIGSQMKVVVEFTAISLASIKNAAGSQNFDGTVGYSVYTDLEGADPAATKWRALLQEIGVPTTIIPPGFAIEYLVRALELAGPDLTREGLIEAIERGFDGSWKCSTCLGPTIFGLQDHWALETMQVTKWDHAQQKYVRIGPVVSYETSQGKGIRGNFPEYQCQPGTCPWKP